MQFFLLKKVKAATNTQKKLPSSSIIHTKVKSSQKIK